ncbi:ornithine cyclodeaminase [Xylophilus ampelinus]|uniref:Ornithine cyclodeaminase n=1 Tax=Xylophilus ampelinus TaxID=54067 RepID=A0A318SMJ4_9BURK|nr:ornithine cyclodeaminase [Xylophilus ampelinus]MCS4509115.1 ornithine cyclodeaminase family protein [Xylophilus ampelinus]PYE79858.1 ornithine cyclodeaminase [Xylophilus ampelinus]
MGQSPQRYGQPGELWVLSQTELENLGVSYTRVLEVVESAFLALRDGDSKNPLKTIVQPGDRRSIGYSMVGRDGASETLGFKVVYEFDPQRSRDAYRFHSFIFLCDDVTGEPIALMDVVKLGPLRTSATSALMARAACPDARTALVVGTGVQGQIALPMLVAALPRLERLMVYGQYQDGLQAVQTAVARLYPERDVQIVTDLQRAAGEADIVIGASGLTARQQVRRAWLRPGSVAVLLGYGVDADVLHGADYRIATDTEQMKVTCEDLAAPDGSVPPVDAELPDILMGTTAARRDETDVVFAYNSGMVVTDVALGRYLADLALAKSRGARVKLW